MKTKWYVQMGEFKKVYHAESAGHAAQYLLLDAIKEKAKVSVFIMGHQAGFVDDLRKHEEEHGNQEIFNDIQMMFTHKVMESLLLDIDPLVAAEWAKIIKQMEDGVAKYDWGDPEINRFMKFVSEELS